MSTYNVTVYGSNPEKRGGRESIHTRQIEATTTKEFIAAVAEVLPTDDKTFPALAGVSVLRVPNKAKEAPKAPVFKV